ncbi:hypothetical protein DFH06DRAFT_730726 [Mycena polygramma]|nr:hypothetical protein DFH06DRAFT_730726 [Mycena polygramma]
MYPNQVASVSASKRGISRVPISLSLSRKTMHQSLQNGFHGLVYITAFCVLFLPAAAMVYVDEHSSLFSDLSPSLRLGAISVCSLFGGFLFCIISAVNEVFPPRVEPVVLIVHCAFIFAHASGHDYKQLVSFYAFSAIYNVFAPPVVRVWTAVLALRGSPNARFPAPPWNGRRCSGTLGARFKLVLRLEVTDRSEIKCDQRIVKIEPIS